MDGLTGERTYLDYNATAPIRPSVCDMVNETMGLVGNPSSVHSEGRKARGVIEKARRQVASLIGAEPANVIFTSGGSEANNTALSPFWRNTTSQTASEPLQRLFVSAIEHPSILAGGQFGPDQVDHLPVTRDGVLDLEALASTLDQFRADNEKSGFLVSVMGANNETGAIQPLAQIAGIVHSYGGIFHADLVQLAGKSALSLEETGADLVSLSAHKIGGPLGVGALVLKSGEMVLERPLIQGGGQEKRRRAGTENVSAIAGFGAAAEEAFASLDHFARLSELQEKLEDGVVALAPDATIFSSGTERLTNTTCFAVPGLEAETLLIGLDLSGVAVSAGSACSSGKVERSHVLDAMGVQPDLNRSALRISTGWGSSSDDIDRFLDAWGTLYRRHKAKQAAA